VNRDHDRLLLLLLYRRRQTEGHGRRYTTRQRTGTDTARMRLECHTVADIEAE